MSSTSASSSALQGGIDLNVGDVSVTGTSTATPAVATSPATTPGPPAAVAPAVPNVTGVHTGEFWSGTLPVILLVGMGLAGLLIIGRRHVASFARSFIRLNRRRGGS